MGFESEAMALLDFAPVQLEVLYGASSGMVVPSVGE
jgi:hypothetical protein